MIEEDLNSWGDDDVLDKSMLLEEWHYGIDWRRNQALMHNITNMLKQECD